MKFDGGSVATFESAWIYPNTHPSMPDSFMEVIGERGHVHLDRKAEAIEMSTEEKFKWPRSLLNYKVFDKWVGAFPSCVNSFVDAVIEDRTPFVTALGRVASDRGAGRVAPVRGQRRYRTSGGCARVAVKGGPDDVKGRKTDRFRRLQSRKLSFQCLPEASPQ